MEITIFDFLKGFSNPFQFVERQTRKSWYISEIPNYCTLLNQAIEIFSHQIFNILFSYFSTQAYRVSHYFFLKNSHLFLFHCFLHAIFSINVFHTKDLALLEFNGVILCSLASSFQARNQFSALFTILRDDLLFVRVPSNIHMRNQFGPMFLAQGTQQRMALKH